MWICNHIWTALGFDIKVCVINELHAYCVVGLHVKMEQPLLPDILTWLIEVTQRPHSADCEITGLGTLRKKKKKRSTCKKKKIIKVIQMHMYVVADDAACINLRVSAEQSYCECVQTRIPKT